MPTRHLFSDPAIRDRLSRPLGKVVSERRALDLARSWEGDVITVGDVVSRTFLENGLRPRIIIFDEKSHRRSSGKFPTVLLEGYKQKLAKNPAGTISEGAFLELKRLINLSGQFALKILGEEDLLGLSAIDATPVGSLVFYGQPDKGIVAVKVNRETKDLVRSILEKTRVEKNGCECGR